MFYYKSFIGNKLTVLFYVLFIFLGLTSLSVNAKVNFKKCTKIVSNIEHNFDIKKGVIKRAEIYSNVDEALFNSVSGDVICFTRGNYPRIKINNIDGGTNNITLKAKPGHKVNINIAGYSGTGISISNSKNIKISGFKLTGGLYGIYANGSSGLTISDNHISDVGQEGISIKSGLSNMPLNNFIVENNFIADTGKGLSQYGEGIYIGDGNDNFNEVLHDVVIKNNYIKNTTNEAIDIKINVVNLSIVSNTIIDTDLKFNGAITVATAGRFGENSNIKIKRNTIRGVTNRSGYRPIGIAIGHGNALISKNFISEPFERFVGVCVFTSFANPDANKVVIKANEIITDGQDVDTICGKNNDMQANVIFK